MGSNNSTMNPNGAEAFPTRVRPILIRKLEEFKKRRNINGGSLRGGGGDEEGAISKEKLLKDNGGGAEKEGENSESSNNHENEHVVRVDKISKVVPLPASELHKEHKVQDQEKVKDVEKNKDGVVEAKIEMVKSGHPQRENKHDDDDDDGDDEDYNEIGRLIGLGSPSFRIYCIEAEEKREEEEEREDQIVAIMQQKTPIDDSIESAASASGNSNEPVEMEPIITTKRKGHKIKKFTAMRKSLLNVRIKHRMNPMFGCSGNDRKSLLSPN